MSYTLEADTNPSDATVFFVPATNSLAGFVSQTLEGTIMLYLSPLDGDLPHGRR